MKFHARVSVLLVVAMVVLLAQTTTATSIINDQASDSLAPAVPSAAKTSEIEQAGKAFGTKIQATFQKMPLKLTMGTLRVATERQSKLKVPSQISSFLKGVATVAGTAPSAPATRTKPPGFKPSPSGTFGSIALVAGPNQIFEIRHTAATKKLLASVDGNSDRGSDSSDVPSPSPPSPSPPLLVSSASSTSSEPPKAKGGASSRLAFLESRGIIGDDKYFKRKVVADHSKFPSTAIGVVASGCSGSLITPRVVATAAHCLYDQEKKKLAKLSDADFTPGEQTKTAKKFVAAYYLVATEYLLGDENYDYAFIVLDKPVTGAGYLGFKENFDGRVANIGYPDIRPRQEHDECHLTDKWFQVRSFHTCDTEGGSSGSAMFDPTDYRIAAIHDGFTTDLLGNPINYATEVEGSVYEVFKAFRKAFP